MKTVLKAKKPTWVFWIVFVSWLILDIATKYWAVKYLKGQDPIVVIPDFFRLIYHINFGVAFGWFNEKSKIFLIVMILALMLWMIWFARTLSWEKIGINFAAGWVAAGAVGNLMDRVKQGYVIDFLDFTFWGWSYPTFNVADTGICVGLGLVLLLEWKKWTKAN
ncbi:MAG: signal peptidase II [Verrucomicrobiia bacterium]